MPDVRCPTCGKLFDREKSAAMPFCSERCRLIDLGRWLDEEHRVPDLDVPEPPAPETPEE